MTFTARDEGVTMGISFQRLGSAAPTTPADGLAATVAGMKSDTDHYPDFNQENFDRNVPYQGGQAAEVQFTFTKNGTPGRARVRVFESGGVLSMVVLAADQKHWEQAVPRLDTFLRTLDVTA